MYPEKAFFEKEDLSSISLMLRKAFNTPRDEVLQKLIEALDRGKEICPKEGE